MRGNPASFRDLRDSYTGSFYFVNEGIGTVLKVFDGKTMWLDSGIYYPPYAPQQKPVFIRVSFKFIGDNSQINIAPWLRSPHRLRTKQINGVKGVTGGP